MPPPNRDRAYARMCKRLGPAGSGQLTKMVNQICIAGLVQAFRKAFILRRSRPRRGRLIDTISKGRPVLADGERYKTMNDGKYDFGFAVEWMRKDLSICLAESRRNGASSRSRRCRRLLCGSGEDGGQALGYVEPFGRLER